jgi:transcriptional regulator with XRE-family HTH domain
VGKTVQARNRSQSAGRSGRLTGGHLALHFASPWWAVFDTTIPFAHDREIWHNWNNRGIIAVAMKDDLLHQRIGAAIRRHREDRGLTAQRVADSLDLPVSTYLKYELGQRKAPLRTLIRLSRYFGMGPGGLVDEAEGGTDSGEGGAIPPLDSNCLAVLRDEEAASSRPGIDLARLVKTWEEALELTGRLARRDLTAAKPLLTRSVTSQSTHVVRFLLGSDEQLAPDARDAAVNVLLEIYAGARGVGLEHRAAREQAAYLAAASGLPGARRAMESSYETEKDAWVRRGIARGLAKAGLPPKIARAHEQELLHSGEMQQVDLGFWRFYAGDERDLATALDRELPDVGYGGTINALLHNVLAGAPRDGRCFDFLTLAHLIERIRPRSISKGNKEVLALVLDDEPRESEARQAWEHLRNVARRRLGLQPHGGGA